MKKIRPIAYLALVTAVTAALGTGSLLAQHSTGPDMDTDSTTSSSTSTSTPRDTDTDTTYSTPKTTASDQSTYGNPKPTDSTTGASSSTDVSSTAGVSSTTDAKSKTGVHKSESAKLAGANSEMAREKNRGYIASAPTNGMQASDLIGTEVKTTNGEDVVGTVDDLIIDENGQVVAIVVGVDGFLDMDEKDVAIGWDDVTRKGTSDDQDLRISVTREALRPAPEFAARQD